MPDKRTHRGPHPADDKLFADDKIGDLRSALSDFSLLLTKGYADKSGLKLVGDRFSLTERQRLAIMRSACSDQQLASRNQRRIPIENMSGQPVAIDGYNVLITIEAAMSGGVIFKGRDGCYRDLASIHGTYRKVTETIPAVQLIGNFLKEIGVTKVLWLLDSPVSNSGRLKTLIGELAQKHGWDGLDSSRRRLAEPERDKDIRLRASTELSRMSSVEALTAGWDIQLVLSPDSELKRTELIVASSDSVVLDGCRKWINLAAEIITNKIPSATVIVLSPNSM